MKKLTRNREHKMVSGVLYGVGQYLGVDPLVVRLVFIVFLLITGVFPGVLIYIIAVLMIPEETLITPSAPVNDATEV